MLKFLTVGSGARSINYYVNPAVLSFAMPQICHPSQLSIAGLSPHLKLTEGKTGKPCFMLCLVTSI